MLQVNVCVNNSFVLLKFAWMEIQTMENIAKYLKDFNIEGFQRELIQWYLEEKRDLPWRKTRDPYRIWVSEIMLQQTRVDTVIPYYEQFMQRFPDIESLAKADEQTLLKAWEGLGYYSRVRNLQEAVREVQTKYGGVVPKNPDEFGALKGVGPYTKGAVLSIAYGLPIPAVDGNVMRVFSRIFCIEEDIGKQRTKNLVTKLAQETISKEDPSSFNQGIMELGALICKPGKPACLLCPVREYCKAFENGKQNELPIKEKKKKGKIVHLTAAVLLDEKGNVLLRKRPDKGLLANLWEFPNELSPKTPRFDILQAFEADMAEKYEIDVKLTEPLCTVEHEFSHLKWHMAVFVGKLESKHPAFEGVKKVPYEQVEDYPMSVPHQKIWKQFKESYLK